MAKKQNKNQPTSTTETNLTPKGMIKDVDASYLSKQNWSHARNAINNSVEGDTGVIGNEPANLLCANIPYTVIGGIHLYGDIWVLFSTDNSFSEIGRFDDSRCEYEKIVNEGCLNFNTDHLIVGVSKENYECQWQIYWDDGLNPSRTLNISAIPWIEECVDEASAPIPNPDPTYVTVGCVTCIDTSILDCDAIRLAPYLDTPCIEVTKSDEGGSLVNGTYQAFIAYTLDNQVIGDYIGVSNLQSFWDHSGPSGSLHIEVSNLDKDFENFQLVIRYKTHNAIRSKIIGYYSTQQTVISIDYIDDRLETVPDVTLVIRNPVFEKSDGMWVVNDYLIRSGPTEKFDFNYQPLANQIAAKWVSYRYPATYYANGGNKPSFMRDEQYTFFIRWIYNTGDKSSSYHIPGRAPGSSDWDSNNPSLIEDSDLTSVGIDITPTGVGATQEKVFEGINTATETVSTIPYNTIVDERYSGVFAGEGDMGYWESTERYPQDSVRWNSNTGNADFDLCGKFIRHHKFPDETTITTMNATLLNPVVNTTKGQFINILGARFDNIRVPVDNNNNLIPGIVGYEILTGSRSGNKSIVAKGIIRNMFTFQRDTESTQLNSLSGPRANGNMPWGVVANYPYNDLHVDPYLINRDRGELVSSRPWFSGVEDNFMSDPHKHASQDNRGLGEITRDYFTFHSPDAMFSRMFLNPNEIKLYKTLKGTSIGNFKRSEDHPRFKLIKSRAVWIAAIIGVGYALNQMRGPESIEVQGAKGQPSGQYDMKAFGSGVGMAPFPLLGNGISLFNSLFHVGGSILTALGRLGMETAIDIATVMGAGRSAVRIGMPVYNQAEGAATGLAGAGSGGAMVTKYEGTDFTGVPTVMAFLTGIYAFLNYIAIGGDKILDLLRNLISYQDYVYKYISHGFYDEETALYAPGVWTGPDITTGIMGINNDSRIRSEVEDARYIKQALSAFPGNIMVNNLKRQSTVVLHTIDRTASQGTLGGQTEYGGLVDPNGNDFSKFTIGDGSCSDLCMQGGASVTWYTPGATSCKHIAANYAALKVNIDNQYGQIDNILMQTSGECNLLSAAEIDVSGIQLSSNVTFGGDVYINRYTEKTSMPFFWDFVKEGEDGMSWDYKQYPNVPFPRYWLDSNKFRMDEFVKPILNFSFDWKGHTPSSLYHLDGPAAVSCEGGVVMVGAGWNTNIDDGIMSGSTPTANYDTTDETLILSNGTNTGAGGQLDRWVTAWDVGAWTIPKDPIGTDCSCPICAGCSTLCGPTCADIYTEWDTLNGGGAWPNDVENYLSTFTNPDFNESYIVYQATTDNDALGLGTAWAQTGNAPGIGGNAPVGTSMPAQANYKWHQNYSVIRLAATNVQLTVSLSNDGNKLVNIAGLTDVVTITHPDDPTDIRDVQGMIQGEYDRGTFYSAGGTTQSGTVGNMSYFRVNNTGVGGNDLYRHYCPTGLAVSNQVFRDLEAEPPNPATVTTKQITGWITGLAAVYNWNTGVFERVVNDQHSFIQPYSTAQTPIAIPSGAWNDFTLATGNQLLPVTDTTKVRVGHGGYSRNDNCNCCWSGVLSLTFDGQHQLTSGDSNTSQDDKGVFGFSGNNYNGQSEGDLIIAISGGTPAPPLGSNPGDAIDPGPPATIESGTDPNNQGGPFVVTNKYMYTHNNGVQDFFVESEVNTAYRDYSDGIITRHYDYADYTDISTMFDATVQDVDNYYKYDKSLSQKRFWNTSFGQIQPRWYDPTISETCLTHFPKRLIYSLPTGGASQKALKQQKKEANKDFWRIFLSKNYRDFKSTVNTIKPINKTGALVLFPTISPQMFQGVDTLKPNKNGTKLIIGDGGLFSQAFQNVANSDVSHEYGSCESARSVVNTPMGLFYISQAQGKVFQYGSKGVSAISDLGMKWWFAKYLPSALIAALPDVAECPHVYDNPVTGIGTQSVYDPVNDIVYFMKKDYEVLSPCVGYVPCEGFLIDNNCVQNGGVFGTTEITGTCTPPAVWNPSNFSCDTTTCEPCVPTAASCPTGYQTVNSTGGCRCCKDDSSDGWCEGNVTCYDASTGGNFKGCECVYSSYPDTIVYPDMSPIELTNTNFFREISWTVSYDPKSKAWISFHDWHPDLAFNSINHFLTTKEDGADACPPGTIWDEDEQMCCDIVSFSAPRTSLLLTLDVPGLTGTTGSPSCQDDEQLWGICTPGYTLVLPCGQNAASNWQYSVCAKICCHCDGNGCGNDALSNFRASCPDSQIFDSWDDGTPCITEQEYWDYEHNADGSVNNITYIDPGTCFATCKHCVDPEIGTSIWRHNTRTDLYANYYGVDYPWEVDLIEHSGQTVTTIRSLEYQLESYIYKNDGRDRFHDLDWNFDEAIIYNTEQVSGLLRLQITPKNNPVLTSSFPIIGGGVIDILYSKEEQKYRFNQFWDITADRGEFNAGIQRTIFNTQMDGYIRNLNFANLDYAKAQVQRKKFRHYYNHILLRRVKSEDRKMLLRLNNTKLNVSMR